MPDCEQDKLDPANIEQAVVIEVPDCEAGRVLLGVSDRQNGNELLRQLSETVRHEKFAEDQDKQPAGG